MVFVANTPGFERLVKALEWATERTIDNCYKVLRVGGEEYKRRVQRVVPRDTGRLAADWHVHASRDRHRIQVDMGTSRRSDGGQPYAIYLELGTKWIANGAVKNWRPGMPPIMEWKAKLRDLPSFFHSGMERRETSYAGKVTSLRYFEKGALTNGPPAGATAKELAKHARDARTVFDRAVKTATRAYTAGIGEQMPFVRPIGLDLAPRIVEALWRTVRNGLKAGLDGKRF